MSDVDVDSLGCIPMDGADGTNHLTVGADNVALINSYLSTNWRSSRLPLMFPGHGWLISDSIDLQAMSGHALFGAGGEVLPRPENHYTAGIPLAGSVSRIVAANRAWVSTNDTGSRNFPSADPMLKVRGYGPKLDGIVLQGLYHPDDLSALQENYPMPTSPVVDHRCAVGIEVQANQSGQGTGKLACPSTLAILNCQTAIKCVDFPIESGHTQPDNADQLILQRFVAHGCDVGLWSNNLQSLGHRIAYFDQLHCDTAFKFEAGGKLWCGTLVMSSKSNTGLSITGRDADGIHLDSASFFIDNLVYDGNNPEAESQVLNITPVIVPPQETSASAPIVNIGFLHVSSQRAANAPVKPLIEINRCYGEINIHGGVNFYEGMIKVTGGTSEFFPTIRIRNAKFKKGETPANIFSSDSSGYVQLAYESCCEMDGQLSSGAINKGVMFPGFQGLLDLPTFSQSNPRLGGFLYQRGQIITVTNDYNASAFDETIICNPSVPMVVNLPLAASMPGKIYIITRKASAALAVTIQRKVGSSDTIDGQTTLSLANAWSARTLQSDGISLWKVLYVP